VTMPWGSTEEPDVVLTDIESTPVHVVSSDAKPGKNIGTEFGSWRTYLVANVVNSQVSTPGAQRLCSRSLRRKRLQIVVNSGGNVVPNVGAFPAIATTGVPVQNPFAFPVTVVLAGFTATQTFVNGIQVGTGNGTFVVPPYGSLSVTFTVLGTTTPSASAQPQSTLDGVIVGSRDFIQNSQQANLSPFIAGLGAGFLGLNDNIRWECQQELWVAYPASNSGPVLVAVCDEQYASDPEAWRKYDR
jgi:hypothetical protein